MPSLDSIEAYHRKRMRAEPDSTRGPSSARCFIATFLITPFAVADVLFVPLVGIILAVMAVSVSFFYLRSVRSFRISLFGLLGFAISLLSLGAISPALPQAGGVFIYLALGWSSFILILYISLLSSATVARYERAADRYASNSQP